MTSPPRICATSCARSWVTNSKGSEEAEFQSHEKTQPTSLGIRNTRMQHGIAKRPFVSLSGFSGGYLTDGLPIFITVFTLEIRKDYIRYRQSLWKCTDLQQLEFG